MKSHLAQAASWAVLLAVGAGAAPATAQTTGSSVDEVVVTGSRIRTSPLERDQPVVAIDEALIAKQGLTSTVDVLQRIPSAGGGLNAKFNNSGNFGNPPDGGGVGAGSAEIDLRYLSSRRVLVLVDGLRWVPGAAASGVPGSVDLNTIPTAMISRMEVLQEGASPIYGSDAIAGVVNIITKDRQEGFQATAQIGQTDHDDGFTQDYNVTWGATAGSLSIVVGGGYFKQDPVFSGDRAISRFPQPFATACDASCSSGTPLGRFIISDPNTGQDLNLTLKTALTPGQRPTYIPGDPTGAASSFKGFTTADRFNFQPFNYISTPLERVSLFGSVRQDITENITFRARASYVQRKSANQAAPLPLFVGPDAGNGNLLDTVSVDASNPFNPFGFTLQPGTYAFIGRRLVENGPRHYEQEVDTWNVTATLQGDFSVGDRNWAWDVNAVYSRNHAEQVFTGNVNAQRVQQALGPVAQCTGACTPLNLFGGAGTITPAMLQFIGFTQQDTSQQELTDFSANLTGELFDLPAGPLAFAVGVERRRNEGYFQPDAIVAAGLSSDIPAQPASGKITVKEAYGELKIPLLADMPFFHRLEGSLAARFFDYSTSGSDETFKAGLSWRPVEELLFRASWGEGFRAPSIGELFGTASRFDQEINDPCSGLTAASPANVRANCIARGVPANGSYVQLNQQISVVTSGNPNLTPETSESWNFSGVWEPTVFRDTSWSRGVSLEVAYTNLELDDAIQAQNGQSLVDRCAQVNDTLACGTITRTASGQIAGIANPLINIGSIKTRAVDVNLVWTSPEWETGQFGFRWYTTRLLEFSEFVPGGSGLVKIEREGTERGSPDQAYPKWKSTGMLDWDKDMFGATVTGRYIHSVQEAGAANKLESRLYVDAQLRWRPDFMDQDISFAVGVNNLFDKDPPGCITCGLNNYDPNAYDAPGRFFYLRLSYRQ